MLTTDALALLAALHRKFDERRRELMQRESDEAGQLPDFRRIDLAGRRLEVIGPADRKTMVNALNRGEHAILVDFEDAEGHTWANNLEGQINLKDRWAGTLGFTDAETGRDGEMNPNPTMLMIRPRGWLRAEEHVFVDGRPVSGALFDFALYAFHNARAALAQGAGLYFCLPNAATAREAWLWNEIFADAEATLSVPAGTIKAMGGPIASRGWAQ